MPENEDLFTASDVVRPPLILAKEADPPPEATAEKEKPPALVEPPDPDAERRYPAWAKIPEFKNHQAPPPGVEIYFVPLAISMMRSKIGGEDLRLRDGSIRKCRQIMLWELSLEDERLAFGRAGGDPNRAGGELAKQMIRAIDGMPATWTDERSPSDVRRIWSDMGPRYRNLLTRLYTAMHVLGDKEVTDFFANCVEQRTATS